jgi:hypothetical protein
MLDLKEDILLQPFEIDLSLTIKGGDHCRPAALEPFKLHRPLLLLYKVLSYYEAKE